MMISLSMKLGCRTCRARDVTGPFRKNRRMRRGLGLRRECDGPLSPAIL